MGRTLHPTAPFEALDSETLDLIFGQYLARTICDQSMNNATEECSLFGIADHAAPDAALRPQPIVNGGTELETAIDAAVHYFTAQGAAVEIVQHFPPDAQTRDVYVTVAQRGELLTAMSEYDAGHIPPTPIDRDRADVRRRRALIVCFLALAEAPTVVARRT